MADSVGLGEHGRRLDYTAKTGWGGSSSRAELSALGLLLIFTLAIERMVKN